MKTNTSISSIVVLFSSSSLVLCPWKAEENQRKSHNFGSGGLVTTRLRDPVHGKQPAMSAHDPMAARHERKGHKWKVESKVKGAEGHIGWGPGPNPKSSHPPD